MVNITKHYLSPKYEKLTVQEKERLLQKYQVNDLQVSCLLLYSFTN